MFKLSRDGSYFWTSSTEYVVCHLIFVPKKQAFKSPFKYTEKSQPNSSLWSWSLTSHRAATKLRGFASEMTDGKMVATSINPVLSPILESERA